MKRFHKKIFILFILIFPLTFLIFINLNKRFNNVDKDGIYDLKTGNESLKSLKSGDIAGTDLYSEQIYAYVTGNKSIIRQSLFTNDTNIFKSFDTNDPAFYKCNMLISASNGIIPELFPLVMTENDSFTQYVPSFNGFSGFLYYKDLKEEDAESRAERALEIIQMKFEMDLIMVKTSEPNFYAFVGHYPNWDRFFLEILKNLPMDGYWKALDTDRLLSEDYLENYHVSSSFMLLNSLDFLEENITSSLDQVNFNMDLLDFSVMENSDLGDLFGQVDSTAGLTEGAFGNFSLFGTANDTSSQEDVEQLSEGFSLFSLSDDSHYTSLTIQYEGLSDGIKKTRTNQYEFDLWKALGYEGEPLGPSKKIFIALTGAFMSEININILCTDVMDTTPDYFKFNNYLIEQLGQISSLIGLDFNIQSFENYSFELSWANEDGITKNYVIPLNLEDESDIINQLPLTGFQGFPYIPTGILDPVEDLIVKYKISNSEPNIRITKEVIDGNASFGINWDFSFNITAENVGTTTVWGVPTPMPVDLDTIFLIIAGPYGTELIDAIWDVVNIEYPGQYASVEEFLNVDEDPRIFQFDTFGTGEIDKNYPDYLNLSNLWPYNEKMDNVIDKLALGYPQLLDSIASLPIIGNSPAELKEGFTNNYSVWNKNNWKMEPNETISYTYSNYSIEDQNNFSVFYSYNFTINHLANLPNLISGKSISGTHPEMALTSDNESWIIESEEKYYDQHEIDIEFFFNNVSNIDLINNTLEMISIVINLTARTDLDDLNFEIFNFSEGIYQDIASYLESSVNNTRTYSFTKNAHGLDWIFDPSSPNFTVIFKIRGIDTELFNFSINDLNIEFSKRDINAIGILGSRILFASSSGNIQYTRKSNSIMLSTFDMASIIAIAEVTSYGSSSGESNTYVLNFKNIGSRNAENVSISVLVPGIIKDSNNFSIRNNYLIYNFSSLAPFEEQTINFTFYTPNSASISKTIIRYNNSKKIQNINSYQLISSPNEVYFSAPIDYITRFPYVRTVEIFINSSDNAPKVKSSFKLKINVKNTGPKGIAIPELNLTVNDKFGDLRKSNENKLHFSNIGYNKIHSVSFTIRKIDWKGYFYPSINYFDGAESRTVQIASSQPAVIGKIELSLVKSVDNDQVEMGDTIIVYLKLTNTGTITVKDIDINDILGFYQKEFSLKEGRLVNNISTYLNPSETVAFSYQIEAKIQTTKNLTEASIDYYFLQKQVTLSNKIEIKVVTPLFLQLLYLIIPCVSALVILGLYRRKVTKYKEEKFELQRNEIFIFRSKDSVLKIENTLRERLNILSSKNDIEETGGEPNE